MKKLFYQPVKENTKDSDILFWCCPHWHHDPKWPIPLWERRGYTCVEEHDAAIVNKWNAKATKDTIGFLLGDTIFGQGADQELIKFFNSIKFKKLYVAPGNHYAGWKQIFEKCENNVWTAEHGGQVIFTPNYLEAYINGQAVVMMHYPILSWNGQGGGSWMLYGHVHNSLKNSEIGRMYLAKGLSREVSVEVAEYPLSFADLRAEMKLKSNETPDHHGKHTQNPF